MAEHIVIIDGIKDQEERWQAMGAGIAAAMKNTG